MPGWELLVPFVLATAAFAYFPGPALLYTAAQTMAHGRRAGMLAALGIHLGCYVHIAAAALGLSAIFRYTPEIYTALKLAGALYLIWLGIGMLRRSGESASGSGAVAMPAFYRSILVELLNPKVAIFFIAFLPQFVDPNAAWPLSVQFWVLGIFVNCAFSSADILTVLLTHRLMSVFKRSGTGLRWVRALGGSILIGLGAKLALSRG